MSEQEFELYLSLLSRFLKLSPRQRTEIADELRDHLAARLEELAADGLPRAEAIRAALEEFGDAADLAEHFTQIARKRTRRLIMRFTVGTVAALAIGIFCVTAFWPAQAPLQMQPLIVAQQAPETGTPTPAPASSAEKFASERDRLRAEVEKILDTATISANFVDTPLQEVLDFLADQNKVAILINRRSLEDAGFNIEELVNLQIGATPLRVVLELLLEPLELTYRVREGFVYVETEAENARHSEVRIYNCSDMLHAKEDAHPDSMAKTLISTLIENTSGPWAETHGEGGSVSEFRGLLVVNTTQQSHREVARLLDMMRSSLAAGPGKQTGQAVTTSASGAGAPRGKFGGGTAPKKETAPSPAEASSTEAVRVRCGARRTIQIGGEMLGSSEQLWRVLKGHADGVTEAKITVSRATSADSVQAVIGALEKAGINSVSVTVSDDADKISDNADKPSGKPSLEPDEKK